MRARHVLLLAAGIPALFAAPAARAGAWPEGAGHFLAIETFSDYHVAVRGYDTSGRPAGNGRYVQYEFAPYIEYGVTDRWTVGIQPRAQEVIQSGLPGTRGATGLVQVNLWARYTIYKGDWNVVSVQGQFGAPGTQTPAPPELAQPGAEYEGRLLFGHAFRLPGGWSGFADVEAAFRLETVGWADQVRLDGTLGVRPRRTWLLLAQTFNTISVGTTVPRGSDYDLYRVAFSVVHKIAPHTALQLGIWHDAGGRDVALGNAGILAVWLRF